MLKEKNDYNFRELKEAIAAMTEARSSDIYIYIFSYN